jgi:hypothetical protein
MKSLILACLAFGLLAVPSSRSMAQVTAPVLVKAVNTEAANGVELTTEDLGRISTQIRRWLQDDQMLVDPASPDAAKAVTIKLTITRYEKGNSAARFILPLVAGVARIEGTVTILGADGKVVDGYNVAKSLNGTRYTAFLSIYKLEGMFAKDLVNFLKWRTRT